MRIEKFLAWTMSAVLVALPASAREFYMAEGTEVRLRLHTSIDTKINQVGDRLICTVEEPVRLEGVEVIPLGTRIHGRISDLQKPRRFPSRGGKLVIAFESVELPGGGTVLISGSLWDVYETDEANPDKPPDVDIGEEGELKAGGPRKLKRAIPLLGGAAAGGAAGELTGGGGRARGLAGAAIGLAVGAGVAFLWWKGKHVELPAGTALIMRVDRGVTLSIPQLPPPRR